jgi:hypothetical protein
MFDEKMLFSMNNALSHPELQNHMGRGKQIFMQNSI